MFNDIEIDKTWSFTGCSVKDTSYITHNYYTYPAKFIPQLAKRLIIEHSQKGDIIVDPFMGSGTTVIESIVEGRVGIGVDINEIAYLAASVKTNPIKPSELLKEFLQLEIDIQNRSKKERDFFIEEATKKTRLHERIDYWYKPSQKEDLLILLSRILEISEEKIKNFFLVAFAQILKTCSIWLQKSIKPTRDLNKRDYNVFNTFLQHSRKMLNKNDILLAYVMQKSHFGTKK